MSFGFSATDFVKAIELVVQLSDALRASGDARSKFHDLIAELFALENALLQIKRLELPEELEFRRLALYTAASRCQECIDGFWSKVEHLQPHRQSSTSSSRVIKDKWARIKWAMCKSSDVDQFRATIRGHTGSIEILLAVIQSDVTQLEAKKRSEEHKTLAGMIQTASCQVLAKLNVISRSVAETALQGKALLDTSALVLRSNIQIFAMIYDMHVFMRRIPGQVQQQQVLLTDPFNRIRPIDLSTIISEEAFLHVMRCIFRDMGSSTEKLDQGDYVIEEAGTGRTISSAIPWAARFAPGQNVAMSIVFKQIKSQRSSCPRCKAQQSGSQDEEITCAKCQTVYRRIQGLNEDHSDLYSLAMNQGSEEWNDNAQSDSMSRTKIQTASVREETIETSAYRRIQIIEVRDAVGGSGIHGKLVQLLNDSGEPVQTPRPLKSILRKPTEKFQEHPDSDRVGVRPLLDRVAKHLEDGGEPIPDGARWTKIDRRLVNPQALEEKGKRFEERKDYVIVLRVLTKDEIQAYAERTQEIRGELSISKTSRARFADNKPEEREERYDREKRQRRQRTAPSDPAVSREDPSGTNGRALRSDSGRQRSLSTTESDQMYVAPAWIYEHTDPITRRNQTRGSADRAAPLSIQDLMYQDAAVIRDFHCGQPRLSRNSENQHVERRIEGNRTHDLSTMINAPVRMFMPLEYANFQIATPALKAVTVQETKCS